MPASNSAVQITAMSMQRHQPAEAKPAQRRPAAGCWPPAPSDPSTIEPKAKSRASRQCNAAWPRRRLTLRMELTGRGLDGEFGKDVFLQYPPMPDASPARPAFPTTNPSASLAATACGACRPRLLPRVRPSDAIFASDPIHRPGPAASSTTSARGNSPRRSGQSPSTRGSLSAHSPSTPAANHAGPSGFYLLHFALLIGTFTRWAMGSISQMQRPAPCRGWRPRRCVAASA